MRKPKKNLKTRIKRKNQNSRKRALKANKQKVQPFVKRVVAGSLIVHDTVQPITKSLWPNQAMPKSAF